MPKNSVNPELDEVIVREPSGSKWQALSANVGVIAGRILSGILFLKRCDSHCTEARPEYLSQISSRHCVLVSRGVRLNEVLCVIPTH